MRRWRWCATTSTLCRRRSAGRCSSRIHRPTCCSENRRCARRNSSAPSRGARAAASCSTSITCSCRRPTRRVLRCGPAGGGRDRTRCWCRACSASKLDGLRMRIGDRRKLFVERCQGRKQGQQRFGRRRLDDQPLAFLAHNRILARKLEFARNPHSLVPAVLEKLDVSFREHRGVIWHMSKHMSSGPCCPLLQAALSGITSYASLVLTLG